MSSIKEKLDKFIENGFSSINLHFTDIFGGFHTLSIPLTELTVDELTAGVPFDSSSVPGFGHIENGDMILKPDMDTVFPYSLTEDENIIGIICNVIEPDTEKSLTTSPRTILAQTELLIQKELNAQSLWLPEPEFYLFDDVSCFYNDLTAMYKFQFTEVINDDDLSLKNSKIGKNCGYHSSYPADKGYIFRRALTSILNELGINVRYHHHEVGAAQNEIELLPETSVKTADNLVIFKYFAKIIANNFDLAITFMPKPLFDFPGSGLHFHQWLSKNGKSLFWAQNGKYIHLSTLASNYIAGLLYHAPALAALTNPSTNSFKRLVPGFEAPTKLFFGLGNRSASVRIPKYVDNSAEKCIEYRPPDFTCNPYLAMAGMLLAGLDGIRKKLDPQKLGFGPFDDDITMWDSERKNRLKSLPDSLSDAANALLGDCEFLTVDGILTENIIKAYAEHLIDDELEMKERITPFEIAKYFGV
ncbi:glutamine synthetase beta-grasp domain-containing protein [bacterium]|nr:glutamine synthetase beta-grasp domain-containing protein [bacterium]